jgi:hypothetical protein
VSANYIGPSARKKRGPQDDKKGGIDSASRRHSLV